jgi:CRP-like cAMP-binding protein
MNQLAGFLKGLPLFASLPDEAIVELASEFERQSLAKDEVLFRKGDPGDALYIIEAGLVRIAIEDEHGELEVLNESGPGDALGQMTLVDGEPRTAEAAVLIPTELLILKRDAFLAVIDKLPPGTIDDLREISGQLRLGYADLLRGLSLFAALPDESVVSLAKNLERYHLEEGEVLFHKGDPGDALYLIDRGWLKVVAEGGGGEELILNQCGPGEALGEMALIDDAPRAAGAVALTPAEVLKLDREAFMAALHDHPEVGLDIMRILSQRLKFTNTYLEQAIDWSRRIAEGDYSFAMDQIRTSQSAVMGKGLSDEARARELLAAFFSMVRGVQEREETLKQQVSQLKIEIDEVKRKQEFRKLTQSDFFLDLKESVKKMREEDDDDDG